MTEPNSDSAETPDEIGDDRTPIAVASAAIVDELDAPTRLLVARRTAPPALAGGWELPGGKVEPGESPVEALHRELFEELGVRVELGDRLPGPLPDLAWELVPPYRMSVWFARLVEGDPRPLEDHDELRWLDLDTLTDVPWLDSNTGIVAALGEHLVGAPPNS